MSLHTDEPLRGIGYYLVASIVFCVADTIAKSLAAQLSIVQITWMRYVVFATMALVLTTRSAGSSFRVRTPWMQLARGMCLAGSSLLFVLGIRDIGLAEAATIGFLGPILVTGLSVPFLGETVGWRRWCALAAGMAGVMVVLRPGTGAFQPEGLFRVASAVFWSIGVILTRKMTATERAETTTFWSAFSGLLLLTAFIPFFFTMPTGRQIALAFGQGLLSSAGQWLVILSLRCTPASILAPFSYTQLLWSTLAGFLVFGAFPDEWTSVGAAIIVASGLYTAHRERVRAREKRLVPVTPL